MDKKNLVIILAGISVVVIALFTLFGGGSNDAAQSMAAATSTSGIETNDATSQSDDQSQSETTPTPTPVLTTSPYLPEGATSDPARTGDDTGVIGIPDSSPISDADAVSASKIAIAYTEGVWNIRAAEQDTSWTSVVSTTNEYGTDSLIASVKASAEGRGETAGWWGNWSDLRNLGYRTQANVVYAYPHDPTNITSATSYDVDVYFYARNTNSSMDGWDQLFEMTPATIHMVKDGDTWKVDSASADGQWVTDYLEMDRGQ